MNTKDQEENLVDLGRAVHALEPGFFPQDSYRKAVTERGVDAGLQRGLVRAIKSGPVEFGFVIAGSGVVDLARMSDVAFLPAISFASPRHSADLPKGLGSVTLRLCFEESPGDLVLSVDCRDRRNHLTWGEDVATVQVTRAEHWGTRQISDPDETHPFPQPIRRYETNSEGIANNESIMRALRDVFHSGFENLESRGLYTSNTEVTIKPEDYASLYLQIANTIGS